MAQIGVSNRSHALGNRGHLGVFVWAWPDIERWAKATGRTIKAEG
jgi:hypothetical protein